MLRPKKSQGITMARSRHQTGHADPVENALTRKGLPFNRTNYLHEAGITEPVPTEVAAQLPDWVNQADLAPSNSLASLTIPKPKKDVVRL